MTAKHPIARRRVPSNCVLVTTTNGKAIGNRRSAAKPPASQFGITTAATIMAMIGQRMLGASRTCPLPLA